MNNKEAFDLLQSSENLTETTRRFLEENELPEAELNSCRYKFSKLNETRRKLVKKND